MSEKTIKAKIWLTCPEDAEKPRARYVAEENDFMSNVGWFKVGEFPVTFREPTREEVIPSVVAAMRKEVSKVRAEAELKAGQIEEGIQKLLALTHEPRAFADSDEEPVRVFVRPADLVPDDDIPF